MAYAEFNTGADFSGSLVSTNVGEFGTADVVCAADGNGSVTLTFKHTYTAAPVVVATATHGTHAFKSVTYTVKNRTTTSADLYLWQGWPTSTITTQYMVGPNLY